MMMMMMKKIAFNVAYSPKSARTCNTKSHI